MTDETDLIPVNSIAFEYVYVANQLCECGGHFAVLRQELCSAPSGPADRVLARCGACQAERTFVFDIHAFFGQLDKYDRFTQTDQLFRQALEHIHARQFAEAEADLRRVVDPEEGEPAFAWAHYNLGMTVLVQGRPHEALPHLERAAEIQPLEPNMRKGLEAARQAAERS